MTSILLNTPTSELQVNTDPAAGKREPAVAALKNGGFVSVWSSANQDSSGLGVYGQRFDNNGTPVGEEFPVNTTTAKNQFEPSIAPLNDGGFVVTWTSYGQDSGDYKTFRDQLAGMEIERVESELQESAGVFAQRYDADGTPVGTEFQVNTKTVCHQYRSQVAGLIDGGFVVIWVQYAPLVMSVMGRAGHISESGSYYGGNGVFGQRYNADGTPAGGEFQVNPRSASIALNSRVSVAALSNGGFVVTWWVQACYARLYNADGTPATGEFEADRTIGFAKVTGLSQGGFVVAWGYRGIVQAKIYNAEGSLTNTIQVSTTAVQGQDVAKVTALNDGGFVVGWNFHNADENINHLCAQRYNADGTPVDGEFRLNQKTAGAFALTTLNDDRIVACWVGQGAKIETAGLVATVEWLSSSQYDTGTFSGFDLDDSGNCLETHVGGGKLYYRVGTINSDKTISFGTSTRYANGTTTSVALAEDGNFVEVHTSGGNLYSRVAKANFSSKTIEWKTDGTPYQQYDTGTYCSVVVDSQNNCLEIHTGSSGLYYRIGKVNYTSKTIDWGAGSTLISQGNYSQCSLTMDAQGNCVATVTGGGLIYAFAGKFTGSNAEWGESNQFEQGSLTSVALDEAGNCIETHTKDNRLYYCVGKLDSSTKTITWDETTQYSEDNNQRYSFTHVACDSQGNCFEIHVIAGSPNRLFYRPGTLTFVKQETGSLATVDWLSSSQYDTGTFSGFDLDDAGNCLETHVGGGRLYYRVGTINSDKTISFGTSTRYANGTTTSVALAEDGNFVEVHTSGGNLYSRVAKANFSSKTIEWKTDGTPYQQYDTGTYCSVVVDSQNNCLEIHTGSSGLYYRIGKVNYTSKTIDWGAGSTLISQGNYSQCSLTMDAQGNCVATAAGSGLIYAHVGKFTGSNAEWGESNQFEQGSLTSVALDNAGNCIETHTKDNRLYYCVGKLDSSTKTITWDEATQYSQDNNQRYSFTHVACDSQGNCFEIHVIAGSPNRLFYRPGTLIPAAPVQAEIPVQEESSGTGPAQIWATIR